MTQMRENILKGERICGQKVVETRGARRKSTRQRIKNEGWFTFTCLIAKKPSAVTGGVPSVNAEMWNLFICFHSI